MREVPKEGNGPFLGVSLQNVLTGKVQAQTTNLWSKPHHPFLYIIVHIMLQIEEERSLKRVLKSHAYPAWFRIREGEILYFYLKILMKFKHLSENSKI